MDDTNKGTEYEKYCAELLKAKGYTDIVNTKASGDQGIDIIAMRDGIKYGFQCKYYSSSVGNSAVQEARAGAMFYKCHVAIVITNSVFTESAKQLADAAGVVLWDRVDMPEPKGVENLINPYLFVFYTINDEAHVHTCLFSKNLAALPPQINMFIPYLGKMVEISIPMGLKNKSTIRIEKLGMLANAKNGYDGDLLIHVVTSGDFDRFLYPDVYLPVWSVYGDYITVFISGMGVETVKLEHRYEKIKKSGLGFKNLKSGERGNIYVEHFYN